MDSDFTFLWREHGITPFWISVFPETKRTYFLIVENGACEAFLDKESLEKISAEGLELFSDRKKIRELIESYKETGKKVFSFVEAQKDLSFFEKQHLLKLLERVKELTILSLGAYLKTEPEATMKVDKAENLDWINDVAEARFELRKVWAALIEWTEECLFPALAKKLGVEAKLLDYFLFEEITGNNAVNPEIAEGRIGFFACTFGKKIRIIQLGKKELGEFRKKIFSSESVLRGAVAYPGHVVGKAIVCSFDDIATSMKKLRDLKEKRILVTEMTRPSILPFLGKISGLITDEGGILCHATIVAREYKLPCIVGTKSATRILKDNDKIELDAENGVARKIS